MRYPSLPPDALAACLEAAAAHPMANPDVRYPAWYRRRQHFLPEGYLSRRSARAYDLVVTNLYNALATHYVHRCVAGLAARFRPRTVVDLGCGPGRLLRELRGALPEAELIAVDLSPFMLEEAARRAGPNRVTQFVHANSSELPVGEGSVELVVALHFFGHIARREVGRVLSEAERVLAPRGRLLIAGHSWHQLPEMPRGLQLGEQRRLLGGLLRAALFERLPLGARSTAIQ